MLTSTVFGQLASDDDVTPSPKYKDLHVISVYGQAGANLAKTQLKSFDTNWVQMPGFGWNSGGGIQFRLKNSWGFGADFGYEMNYFVYDHQDFRIRTVYSVPSANFRITKYFRQKLKQTKLYYLTVGGNYLLANGKSYSDGDHTFTYNGNLASSGVIAITPEIGFQSNMEKNAFSIGVQYRYGLSSLYTNKLQDSKELNAGLNTFNSGILGISFKYYYGVFAIAPSKGKNGKKNGKNDPVIRIGL